MNIKILIAYHKIAPIYANKNTSGDVLAPILLGAANASETVIGGLEKECAKNGIALLRDDVGENISDLNPHFCELTALFWAWKNLKADVYGLFHYRRAMDFSGRFKGKNKNDNKIRLAFDKIAKKFALTQQGVESALKSKADIITSKRIIVPFGFDISLFFNQYEIYAKDHHQKDLDIVLNIIREKYPHYEEAIDKVFFTRGQYLSWCNMFVMKKDLFFEYCEWLFDILFEARKRIDLGFYTPYQARIFGFLAERLQNVFVVHKELTSHARVKTLQSFVFKNHRPFFGYQTDGNVRRFFVCKLRVKKEIL